jgi:hypothetical protein
VPLFPITKINLLSIGLCSRRRRVQKFMGVLKEIFFTSELIEIYFVTAKRKNILPLFHEHKKMRKLG